ncbi:MAG: Crp/Fnr family transcriptional regulator [Rhodospirillales bacterium]|nr:Crp/Fnr family transcriptional regulator [Rhodospirillales bacterium]
MTDSEGGKRRLKPPSSGDDKVLALDTFNTIPLIAGLPKNVRIKTSSEITRRPYGAGSEIVSRGDTRDEVFFLFTGSAQVINYSDMGRVVAYASLGPGDLFGELTAIDGKPRSATVIARTPCTVGTLPGEKFMQLVTKYERPASILLRRLAGIIRSTDERIEALSLMDAEQRVCLELLRYLEPDPGSMDRFRVYPAPSHVEMAHTIGVTRQTVARIFSRLAKDQVVEREGKVLYIRDHGKLKEAAFQVKTTQV